MPVKVTCFVAFILTLHLPNAQMIFYHWQLWNIVQHIGYHIAVSLIVNPISLIVDSSLTQLYILRLRALYVVHLKLLGTLHMQKFFFFFPFCIFSGQTPRCSHKYCTVAKYRHKFLWFVWQYRYMYLLLSYYVAMVRVT